LSLPDGRSATYYGVVVLDCVHVVALEKDETTYLVRQRRPNARAPGAADIPETLELPGGFADPGCLERCASRELAEEVGKAAASLTKVGILYPSPGISSEQDHIFMATDLSDVVGMDSSAATEQDVHVISGRFGQLYQEMLRQTLPVPAQTLAAMALVAVRL